MFNGLFCFKIENPEITFMPFFSDVFQFGELDVSEKGIAWPSDVENKFRKPEGTVRLYFFIFTYFKALLLLFRLKERLSWMTDLYLILILLMNILLFGCVRLTICQYVKFFNF